MFSVTSYTSTRTGSENPPDELQISEEEFTQIKAEIIPSGLLLRAQWQSAANPSLIYWETQVQVPRTKGTQQAERRERRRRSRRLGSGRLLRGVRPKSCPLKGPKTTKNKIQADSIWRHCGTARSFIFAYTGANHRRSNPWVARVHIPSLDRGDRGRE